ncbi:hypothetical protein HYH02_004405 [Chlamydomonas schloesseri]|uniref:Uncharacterized protein n=1 Tax=Chlamydomonas schloesseri TaxID=2026947 RepID=A0A835WNM4_9CHLO|nr:hypothetical protein HYH02_004405 [Chlamydomonas schloesseri]|eukprot:KAG2451138.1 hypothetical protein HYH02_004405 [Chlamydomonas schloesseri]
MFETVKEASGPAKDDEGGESPAPPADSAPGTLPKQQDPQPDYPRLANSRPPENEVASTSYPAADDTAALLHKFSVHPTSSPRVRGLIDVLMMVLTLIPTAVLRLVRACMGLVGVTEHRWRGISLHVPLTLEDRKQLELLAANLVAGRIGRRPEAPERGPVPPSQQLTLDVHAILAAAASTAAAFALPYEGMPEAALHAKLSSYIRGVASWDTVCTQDCFKAMRKLGRKTMESLCAAAPRAPAPAPPASSNTPGGVGGISAPHLRKTPSAASMMVRPKPKAVAKAFMAACLMQLSRAHAETLIQLVAALPDGSDLVETVSLISLAPGAEYLRLLGEERFAEQLEAMSEFGRLRPSDAKKEPEVQGMAINARVHEVGVVRHVRAPAPAGAVAEAHANSVSSSVRTVGSVRGATLRGSSQHHAAGLPVLEGGASELAGVYGGGASGGPNALRAGKAVAAKVWMSDFDDDEDGDGAEQELMAFGKPAARGTGRLLGSTGGTGRTGLSMAEEDEPLFKRMSVRQGGTGGIPAQLNTATSVGPAAAAAAAAPQAANGYNAHGAGASATGRTTSQAPPPPPLPQLMPQPSGYHSLPQPIPLSAELVARGGGAAAAAAAGDDGDDDYTAAATAAATATANGRPLHPHHHHHSSSSAAGLANTHTNSSSAFSSSSALSTTISHYPTDRLDVFQPIYGCPRSGAFAVHGREPRGVGLSRLVTAYATCHSLPAPEQSSLLASLGYSHPEQLRQEVELRKALCVAQALPVVVASLKLQCRQPACLQAAARSGCFMHVQQSLLSDLHRHERAYLEDTKGALDVLADRLLIRFVAGSERVLPLHISGPNIVVSLPADCVRAEALAAAGLTREDFCGPDKQYGLNALVFNMGINTLQSLGFLNPASGGAEPLQQSLNRFSLERLNEFAGRAGHAHGPALAALNAHFGPRGHRPPKDTEMFALVRRACMEVGAGRAVNCKSGKDRTALELCRAFADEVVGAGLLPAGAEPWLQAQFMRGLSYMTTSQNHGQPPAYAFNEMEIATLPAGWRPDWRLCGKVAT